MITVICKPFSPPIETRTVINAIQMDVEVCTYFLLLFSIWIESIPTRTRGARIKINIVAMIQKGNNCQIYLGFRLHVAIWMPKFFLSKIRTLSTFCNQRYPVTPFWHLAPLGWYRLSHCIKIARQVHFLKTYLLGVKLHCVEQGTSFCLNFSVNSKREKYFITKCMNARN